MMRTATILSALLVSVAFAASFPEEDNVIVLTDDNFDEALQEHDPLLVEFYAPWCGHCKKLAPEYADAAGTLKEEGLYLAKVDATENRELAERFSVQGFPTLKFFRGGQPMEYGGGRTSKTIVDWVRKKSGPATEELTSKDDLAKLVEDEEAVAVAYFQDDNSAAAETYKKVALSVDDTKFLVTTDANLFQEATGVAPEGGASLVVVRSFDEGAVPFEGDDEEQESAAAVERFVRLNSVPLVMEFSQENAPKIFGGPVQSHLLVFADPEADGHDDIVDAMEKVARTFFGELLAIVVPPSEARVMDFFGLKEEDLPVPIIVDMSGGGALKKYRLDADKEINEETLTQFGKDFFDGNLKELLKSEDPEDSDLEGPVVVVRGKTFAEIALQEDKDVLLEFYAPWCGHCKKLAPVFEEVGQEFQDQDKVVVAKMDATANEISYPGVSVEGFPTIYFFPAGKDKEAVEYDGDRTVDGFVSFLKKHGKSAPLQAETDEDEHDEL